MWCKLPECIHGNLFHSMQRTNSYLAVSRNKGFHTISCTLLFISQDFSHHLPLLLSSCQSLRGFSHNSILSVRILLFFSSPSWLLIYPSFSLALNLFSGSSEILPLPLPLFIDSSQIRLWPFPSFIFFSCCSAFQLLCLLLPPFRTFDWPDLVPVPALWCE